MSTLEVHNVTVIYPEHRAGEEVQALSDVELTIHDREFIVALGASGCGKTTLLNLMAGFIAPTQGQVLLDDHEVMGPGSDRGVVFQKHALLPWLNVMENAEFGLKLQGIAKRQRRELAARNLALVGL